MIKVTIIVNGSCTNLIGTFTALCAVSGPADEFKADSARLQALPYDDRYFVYDAEPKHWKVRNAEKYAELIPDIKGAIEAYKRQLRFPI